MFQFTWNKVPESGWSLLVYLLQSKSIFLLRIFFFAVREQMSFIHVMLKWPNIITRFSANKRKLISLFIFMYVAMATAHTSVKSGLLTRVLSCLATKGWRISEKNVTRATRKLFNKLNKLLYLYSDKVDAHIVMALKQWKIKGGVEDIYGRSVNVL